MRKFKLLIVDDEEPARGLLALHASKLKEIEIVATCENAVEAKRVLSTQQVDILLLDIRMDEITGLDLLRMLKNKPATILTTAYSEYALEGYELDVIDYLVKPIEFDRFFKAISKAMDFVNTKNVSSSSASQANMPLSKNMFIKVEQHLIKVEFEDILYFEGFGEYVKIFTTDKMHMTLRTMTSFEESLPQNQFYRIHRSYIINIDKIEIINDGSVKIKDKWIPISRRLRDDFLSLIKKRGMS